jgi:N-acetylmuramoyl-L-alanine amidase
MRLLAQANSIGPFTLNRSSVIPIVDKEKGIYAFDDLVVLKTATMPAVLLECGVIVNRTDEENLNNPAYRKRLVEAICRAVQDFSSDTTKEN